MPSRLNRGLPLRGLLDLSLERECLSTRSGLESRTSLSGDEKGDSCLPWLARFSGVVDGARLSKLTVPAGLDGLVQLERPTLMRQLEVYMFINVCLSMTACIYVLIYTYVHMYVM